MADSWKENQARYARNFEISDDSRADKISTGVILAVVGVMFCWAVNVLSPGAINLITGLPFTDSLILGAGIGFAGYMIRKRWQAWHFDIDEIEEVAENAMNNEAENANRQTGCV